MQIRRSVPLVLATLALLTGMALLLPGTARAGELIDVETTAAYDLGIPWGVTGSIGATSDDFGAGAELLFPLYYQEDTLLFLYPEVSFYDKNRQNYSLGLGARHYFEQWDAILGINAFWDIGDSRYDNTYHGFGLGAEVLTHRFDARFNWYNYEDKTELIDTRNTSDTSVDVSSGTIWGAPFGRRNSILQPGTTTTTTTTTTVSREFNRFESAMDGIDFEGGVLLPWIDQFVDARVFAGYYNYDNDFGSDLEGFKARGEVRLNDFITLDVAYYQDRELMGGKWFGGARVHFPLGRIEQPVHVSGGYVDPVPEGGKGVIASGKSPVSFDKGVVDAAPAPISPVRSRMTENIIRTTRLITAESDFIEDLGKRDIDVDVDRESQSHLVTLLDDVVFVNNNGPAGNGVQTGNDGTGTGTAERPKASIPVGTTLAQANTGSTGRIWNVFVQGGGPSYVGDFAAAPTPVHLYGSVQGRGGHLFGGVKARVVGGFDGGFGNPDYAVNGFNIVQGLSGGPAPGTGILARNIGQFQASHNDIDTRTIGIFVDSSGFNRTQANITHNWIASPVGIALAAEDNASIGADVHNNHITPVLIEDAAGIGGLDIPGFGIIAAADDFGLINLSATGNYVEGLLGLTAISSDNAFADINAWDNHFAGVISAIGVTADEARMDFTANRNHFGPISLGPLDLGGGLIIPEFELPELISIGLLSMDDSVLIAQTNGNHIQSALIGETAVSLGSSFLSLESNHNHMNVLAGLVGLGFTNATQDITFNGNNIDGLTSSGLLDSALLGVTVANFGNANTRLNANGNHIDALISGIAGVAFGESMSINADHNRIDSILGITGVAIDADMRLSAQHNWLHTGVGVLGIGVDNTFDLDAHNNWIGGPFGAPAGLAGIAGVTIATRDETSFMDLDATGNDIKSALGVTQVAIGIDGGDAVLDADVHHNRIKSLAGLIGVTVGDDGTALDLDASWNKISALAGVVTVSADESRLFLDLDSNHINADFGGLGFGLLGGGGGVPIILAAAEGEEAPETLDNGGFGLGFGLELLGPLAEQFFPNGLETGLPEILPPGFTEQQLFTGIGMILEEGLPRDPFRTLDYFGIPLSKDQQTILTQQAEDVTGDLAQVPVFRPFGVLHDTYPVPRGDNEYSNDTPLEEIGYNLELIHRDPRRNPRRVKEGLDTFFHEILPHAQSTAIAVGEINRGVRDAFENGQVISTLVDGGLLNGGFPGLEFPTPSAEEEAPEGVPGPGPGSGGAIPGIGVLNVTLGDSLTIVDLDDNVIDPLVALGQIATGDSTIVSTAENNVLVGTLTYLGVTTGDESTLITRFDNNLFDARRGLGGGSQGVNFVSLNIGDDSTQIHNLFDNTLVGAAGLVSLNFGDESNSNFLVNNNHFKSQVLGALFLNSTDSVLATGSTMAELNNNYISAHGTYFEGRWVPGIGLANVAVEGTSDVTGTGNYITAGSIGAANLSFDDSTANLTLTDNTIHSEGFDLLASFQDIIDLVIDFGLIDQNDLDRVIARDKINVAGAVWNASFGDGRSEVDLFGNRLSVEAARTGPQTSAAVVNLAAGPGNFSIVDMQSIGNTVTAGNGEGYINLANGPNSLAVLDIVGDTIRDFGSNNGVESVAQGEDSQAVLLVTNSRVTSGGDAIDVKAAPFSFIGPGPPPSHALARIEGSLLQAGDDGIDIDSINNPNGVLADIDAFINGNTVNAVNDGMVFDSAGPFGGGVIDVNLPGGPTSNNPVTAGDDLVRSIGLNVFGSVLVNFMLINL